MKTSFLTARRDPYRRVTTIYFTNRTFKVVEVIEWGAGTTPNVVQTATGQILRQGIDGEWSSYPNQSVVLAFRQSRQSILKRTRGGIDTGSSAFDNVA